MGKAEKKEKGEPVLLPLHIQLQASSSFLVVACTSYDNQQYKQYQRQCKVIKTIAVEDTHLLSLLSAD
jgi:hypothetical protein